MHFGKQIKKSIKESSLIDLRCDNCNRELSLLEKLKSEEQFHTEKWVIKFNPYTVDDPDKLLFHLDIEVKNLTDETQ